MTITFYKKQLCLLTLAFAVITIQAQDIPWGDKGNGKYINPILAADYSDPDVIRVGEKN